ncbi:MAG: carbohydrate-binding domain-containing protein [Bacilli bacterium]|nr:carbohydrate-binding domain-containing protein [Bacilli bacterium]
MKKKTLIPLSILAILAMVGCSSNNNHSTDNSNNGSDYDYNDPIEVDDPEVIEVVETNEEFSITSEDGTYSQTGSVYKITSAGTFALEGKLEGQILIEAGEDDVVVLELNGVSITYDSDSPIKAVSGDKLEISAKKNTDNVINDTRSAKTSDVASQGEGAIYADIDLKLKGTGTLVVTGNYNNAIHTTKDLTIQKLTLKATGYNNALKGNDNVTITSGTVQAYAKTGNGIKTENSDISSKGNQRGTVAINGGYVYVDSLHDAIDASYNIEVDEADSEVMTTLSIKTGTNATYYNKSSFKADSEKGLKATNEIIVNKGTITIAASDDAIHANYGDALENGNEGLGNITINDGLIQVASGDDGLHADNTLTVNGGKVVVTGATEGFEGNYIDIKGGYSYIYGTDDGVNCSQKSFNSCAFTMSGGYLDVAVKSGDTDGIDSNGNFTLSGGTIVTRGSPGTSGGMSTGLDVDGTISMTGGTLIAFNGLEKSPSSSNIVKYAGTSGANSSSGGQGFGFGGRAGFGGQSSSSVTLSAGNYVLSGTGLEVSFTNDYVYGSFQIYSSLLTTGSTYTLSRGDSTVLSWTQSSNSVTIS